MKHLFTIFAMTAAFVLSAAESANLLTGIWKEYVWVHTSDAAGQALRSKVVPLVKFEQNDVDGKKVLRAVIPAEIAPVAGKYASSFSGSFFQKVALPDNKGGKFVLTFNYKGSVPENFKSVALILVIPKEGAKSGKLYARSWGAVSADWKDCKYEFTLPAGTDSLEFYFRLSGPGDAAFKDFSLSRIN